MEQYGTVSQSSERSMAGNDDGSERWIETGLEVLAEGGIDRVRVEVVAARLGVTKGGFYRRFRDRQALHSAMLDTWRDGRIAVINKQTRLDGMSAAERLGSIVRLYSERISAQGMAIELAIRQWARSDPLAASAVARVDAERLKNVQELYHKLGLGVDEAHARSVLFYSFIFGQSLLVLDQTPRKRATLIAACIEALTRTQPG
jgi:AcrR family transcriptional regulator